jgi:hypothetical protein
MNEEYPVFDVGEGSKKRETSRLKGVEVEVKAMNCLRGLPRRRLRGRKEALARPSRKS